MLHNTVAKTGLDCTRTYHVYILCKFADFSSVYCKQISLQYVQILNVSTDLLQMYYAIYRISSLIRQCFFLPKQSQKSRSVLQDGSRSLGLFRKGKTRITAKLQRADMIICTHSREGKPRLIAE